MSFEDVRVVVVEDDDDTSSFMRALLQADGYNVRIAASAAQALAVVASHSPQCVLLDLGLPDLDGVELARQLREQHGDALVLIAITGRGSEHDRREADRAGIDFMLGKPLDLAALRQMLPKIE